MPVITDSDILKERIKPLLKEPFVAVDTEFIREKTFYPVLCLVQVAGKDDAFAIDTMARGIDLTPLFKLLRSKKVVKVFHAAQQDIEIFINHTGKVPTPLFDTQIAAQVLGHGESISYANLVKKICNKTIDKSSRFTDWAKRPLSEKQIAYALSDVTYLRDIYESISEELKQRKRESWVKEEVAYLTDIKNYNPHPEDAWQRLKIKTNQPRFLAMVKELARWRELRAREEDIPRRRVMRDETLLELAASEPKTKSDLLNIRHRSGRLGDDKIARSLLETVEKGRKARPPKPLKSRRVSHGNAALVDLLKVLLKAKCEEHHVSQSMVAKIEDLERIVVEAKPKVAAMKGWRREVFGNDALRLKHGKIALSVKGRKVALVEQE